MTRVSVVLPFYQHDNEFDEAIKSIVAQTLPDWRLLLVANNPNERALDIAEAWTRRESRIERLHEPRQGIAHALNLGLSHCDTPFVARMDADDISAPERLERQLAFMEKNPETGLVGCRTRFESPDPAAEGFHRFVEWQNSILTPEAHALYRFIESPLAHPGVFFRKSLIDRWGGYETGPVPEDYELWLRWMDRGVLFHKLPEILLTWRDTPGRLTRTHPHYAKEAFWQVKSRYLAFWLRKHVAPDRKIVLCGGGKTGKLRGAMLAAEGVEIYGYTDVKKRSFPQSRFIPLDSIDEPAPWFLINTLEKRGVGEAIAAYFSGKGFREGVDFIRAG
jgi:glycosyltransferase involved in cell wall biosynthesis